MAILASLSRGSDEASRLITACLTSLSSANRMDIPGGQADETLPEGERSVGQMLVGLPDSPLSGMTAFLNEYVVQRGAPIPKLLYAFGVCLVRVSSFVALRQLPSIPDA